MKTLVLLLLLVPVSLSAQVVNIENRRIFVDTTGWSGSVGGGFSAVQNVDLLYTLNFRAHAQYKTRKHYYLLLSDVVYTASSDDVYANSGMAHFRYAYRLFDSPWKWESYAQVQYNELLNQRLRSLLGTGIRWKMYDKNSMRFFIGTSTFYEYEELQTDGIVNRGFRWSNYLSWFISTKSGITFTATTYAQPLWSDMADIRISGQYALGFKATKRLDIKLEYSFFHDSEPPVNVRKTVFSSQAGFQLKLGK